MTAALANDELAILFWNNHFSVVTKRVNRVCCLLSDVAYADTEALWSALTSPTEVEHLNYKFDLVAAQGQ